MLLSIAVVSPLFRALTSCLLGRLIGGRLAEAAATFGMLFSAAASVEVIHVAASGSEPGAKFRLLTSISSGAFSVEWLLRDSILTRVMGSRADGTFLVAP